MRVIGMLEIIVVLSRITSAAVLTCAAIFAAHAEPRALIELFTSQGCSSCPPADKLIGEFANNPSVVAMSLAVDYWDYIGWKDTLALSANSKRQRDYAKARGDREIYTPQVVVNGITHVVGNDRGAIERAIVQTRRDPAPMRLPITLKIAGNMLTVDVSAAQNEQGQAEIWLIPIIKTVSVAIARGENHGRSITYSNVVRQRMKLGDWIGKAETFNLPIKDFQSGEVDSVVVMVQRGAMSSPGLMLGAAITSLR